MCLRWEYKAHVLVFFSHLHESQIRYAHNGRKDICILGRQSRLTFISIYKQQCDCHCRICRHCLWNSRENWNTCVMRNNRFNHVKCDTWAIRLYEITSSMGRYFDYCMGFICSCQLPWFWWFCGTRWRSQRSRGDEVLFATGTFVGVLNANVASAVCTRHSRDAVLGSSDALSWRFPYVLGQLDAHVPYFKEFGGQRGVWSHPKSWHFYGVWALVGTIKGGLKS